MSYSMYYGSGRAKCCICEKQITQDELQVNFSKGGGVNSVNANAHWNCLEEMKNDCVLELMKETE